MVKQPKKKSKKAKNSKLTTNGLVALNTLKELEQAATAYAARNQSAETNTALTNLLRAMKTYELELDDDCVKTTLLAVEQLVQHGRSEIMEQCWWIDYKKKPPTPTELLHNPLYFGDVQKYDFWLEHLEYILDPANGVHELICGGSLGLGKTFISALVQAIKLTQISFLRDPAKYFGLEKNSRILFGIFSVTKEQTKNGYGDCRKMLHQSPYIRKQFPFNHMITKYIQFNNYPLEVIPGSQELHALGGNLASIMLDEMNFRLSKDPDAAQGARTLYSAVSRRVTSRFGSKPPGILCLISSARDASDFLEEHLKTVKDRSHVHYVAGPLWAVRPAKDSRKFVVFKGSAYQKPRILKKGEMSRYIEDELIEVPFDYYKDFRQDCDGAVRDIAGVPTYGVDSFIKQLETLPRAYKKAKTAGITHPFVDETTIIGLKHDMEIHDALIPEKLFMVREGRYLPARDPLSPRVIHIDIGLTGDALGFAIGHVNSVATLERRKKGTDETLTVTAPEIIIDFVMRVKSPPGDEVPLFRIRNFIAWLSSRGFNIQKVTLDGFQSADSKQLLREAGYNSAIESIDRNDLAYMGLRQAFTEERITVYKHATLDKELRGLEHDIKKRKVDHGKTGSKDISDALAGVVWSLVNDEELWKPETGDNASQLVELDDITSPRKQRMVKPPVVKPTLRSGTGDNTWALK